jgi:hypothetical protein
MAKEGYPNWGTTQVLKQLMALDKPLLTDERTGPYPYNYQERMLHQNPESQDEKTN